MVNACVLVYETGLPIPFTCSESVAIAKGDLLLLTDPMTVATATGDNDEIIGIAAEEKIASDGKTKIAVYMEGIFRGVAGAAGVTVGIAIISDVATAGADNEMVIADGGSESTIGMALETATDLQTFMFQLNPMHVQIA